MGNIGVYIGKMLGLLQNTDELWRSFKINGSYIHCSYINPSGAKCLDISTILMQKLLCPSVVVNKYFKARIAMTSQATFIFFDGINVNDTIAQIANYTFWGSRKHNYFIICNEISSITFLHNFMVDIWRNGVLNFIVAFIYKGMLQVFLYNPFIDKQLNVTYGNYWFPDKLKDVFGYTIKVSLFDDYPLTTNRYGSWEGDDYNLLKLFMSVINATYDIIIPTNNGTYLEAFKDMDNNKSDLCLIGFFMQARLSCESSYAHAETSIALLIPFKHSEYYVNVHIFYVDVWILLIAAWAIIAGFALLNPTRRFSLFFESCFYLSSTFFGNIFPKLNRKRSYMKIAIMTMILCSIITRTAFQSLLISNFVNSAPPDQIREIEELQNSDLIIYTPKSQSNIIPKSYNLNSKFNFITRQQRIDMLDYKHLNTSGAYLMSGVFAKEYTHIFKKRLRQSPFYILDIVPGFQTFIFKKRSPYLDKINIFLRVFQEFDLSKKNTFRKVKPKIPKIESVLNFEHLKTSLAALIIGLIISSVVFIIELIIPGFRY